MKKFSVILLVLMMLLAFATQTFAEEGKMKVVFLGESASTDIVWDYRAQMMKKAADELGIDFSYRFANGDYAAHTKMVDEEVIAGANAIIAPFWDESIYSDVIANAVEKGVIIYGILGMGPKATLSDEIVSKLGWAEFDWYAWGSAAGKEAINVLPSNPKILWPAEVPSGTYITDAVRGFEDAFNGDGREASIEVIEATADPTTAISRISAYLLANQDVNAVITSGAISIDAANVAYRDLGWEPGKVALVGQVTSPSCVEGIKEGYMPFGVNLELTDSSYFAILNVWAMHTLGAEPIQTDVAASVITIDNIVEKVPAALQE